MATPLALRAAEASALTYRTTWRGSVFTTVVSPVLFLAAMGLGLGALVDDGRSVGVEGPSGPLSGVGAPDYLSFLAPGLLAAAAMQTGAFESLWPVMAGIRWRRSYHAMLATPLSAADIAVGHVLWATVRVLMTSVAFLIVMLLFGATESWWVVLALPAAVLTGVAHTAPLAGITASLESDYGVANIMRFGVVPLFLFSGTFFPIEQLPDWVEPAAYVTPLWHGVELCRSLSLGDASLAGSVGHVAYMALFVVAGVRLTIGRFEKRLVA